MTLIIIKFLHYLAILFSGGLIVGGGVIQSVFTKANQVTDLNFAKILKFLSYLGFISLIILWITGMLLAKIIYGGFSINSSFTLKIIAAALLLGLSTIINLHIYNCSKKKIPPNNKIIKLGIMFSRGLIVIVLIGAAAAFS